jgi:two-component system, response regulator PdtaR
MSAKLKVLIVEDDIMIAEMTEEVLVESGYEVCGIAGAVDEALSLARLQKPDLALIDLRLGNSELGTDVAARLESFGRVGVLYTTGNAATDILRGAVGEACLIKPYQYDDLLRALEIVAGLVSTGAAVPPFPRGFQLLRTVSGNRSGYSRG